jgi:lipoprotein
MTLRLQQTPVATWQGQYQVAVIQACHMQWQNAEC